MKIKVGVLFGGRSVEHEISIITAVQAMLAFDKEKYEIVPIYITKDSRFFTGKDLMEIEQYKDIETLLKKCKRVILQNIDGKVKLINYPMKKFSNNEIDYIDIAFIYLDMNKTQDALATLSSGILKYPYERKLYNEKLKLLQKVGNTKDYNLLKIQMNNKFPKETVYLGK